MDFFRGQQPALEPHQDVDEKSTFFGSVRGHEEGDRERLAGALGRDGRKCKSSSVGACILMILFVMWGLSSALMHSHLFLQKESGDSSSTDEIVAAVATVTNDYGNTMSASMFAYPFLESSLLMEPLRSNKVEVSGPELKASCGVRWIFSSVDGSDGKVESEGETSKTSGYFEITPKKVGQYKLYVSQACSTYTYTSSVYVRYVRRELSTLTETDREEFLDAMYELWATNTVDGQKKYGSRYKSAYYFATIHNDGSGNCICDQFNAGPGFFSNHVFLSAYFEQSLRLVNPRVSLHYMDYTQYFGSEEFIYNHLTNTLDGGVWSEIMTDKWFGTNNPSTGRIINSRWANLQIPTMDAQFFADHGISEDELFFPDMKSEWELHKLPTHIYNPYGLLRPVWNFSPQTIALRFNSISNVKNILVHLDEVTLADFSGVTCKEYSEYLNSSVFGQSISTALENMEGQIHGAVHQTLGGSGGERGVDIDIYLRDKYGLDDEDLVIITIQNIKYLKKNLPLLLQGEGDTLLNCTKFPFQDGIVTNVAMPGETDGMRCELKEEVFNDEATLDKFIHDFISKTQKEVTDLDVRLKAVEPFKDKIELIKLIISRIQYSGELSTPSAPVDPLFWVIHGAFERLYQRIMIDDFLHDKKYDSSSSTCEGHVPGGVKAWLEGFYFMDEHVAVSRTHNSALLPYLDPTSDEYRDNINYVYDTSEYNWCNPKMFRI